MFRYARAIGIGLLAATAFAGDPFTFIQMSDPQFGMFTENKGFEHETANFEFAIATANRLHPKFVVITGDLINQAGNAAQGRGHRGIGREPALRAPSPNFDRLQLGLGSAMISLPRLMPGGAGTILNNERGE